MCSFMEKWSKHIPEPSRVPVVLAALWKVGTKPRILIGSELLNICNFNCTSSRHSIFAIRLAILHCDAATGKIFGSCGSAGCAVIIVDWLFDVERLFLRVETSAATHAH